MLVPMTSKKEKDNKTTEIRLQNSPQHLEDEESSDDQRQNHVIRLKDGTCLIDHKALPYIFRFNHNSLQALRMSVSEKVPKIAHTIFSFLIGKLLISRYTQGGTYPNRMKHEEKVKFVMRAFGHLRSRDKLSNKQRLRFDRYNIQNQKKFFQRQDVKANFLKQIYKTLQTKKAENFEKILQFEYYIEKAIKLADTDPEDAQKIFRDHIVKRQLPWTDNMFMDILEFSRMLYLRHTNLDPYLQKQIMEMKLFKPGEWQVDGRALQQDEKPYSLLDQLEALAEEHYYWVEKAE